MPILDNLIVQLSSARRNWWRQGRAIVFVALTLLVACTAAVHADERPDEEPWEDPSCREVWRAVIMTEVYPSFTSDLSLINEAGASRPFMRREITPTERREKRHFEKDWRTSERLGIEETSWDRFEPRLTNCSLVGTENSSLGPSSHWRANWSNFPYKAEMDVWILTEHQLVGKSVRRYLSHWEYPEERVMTVNTFGDLPQFSAFKQANVSEVSESCDAITQMAKVFDATPAVQVTRRFLNDGFGQPFLGQVIITGTKVYRRDTSWPWHLHPRLYGNPEEFTNCKLLGHQEVNGIATKVYDYERPEAWGGTIRIRSWISNETHLPVIAHFKRLTPDNGEEYYSSYSYDPEVKEPI